MSELSIASITSVTNGAPNFTTGMSIAGTNITSSISLTEYYEQQVQPVGASTGALWWDGTNMYQFINSLWRKVAISPPPKNSGDRGLVADMTQFFSYGIDYYNIVTTSVKADFGTLTNDVSRLAGCSNGSRGIFGGGIIGGTARPWIQYVTVSTLSNSTVFGDLTVGRYTLGACSNGTRGVFGGGNFGGTTIDYITIATTGNATSFGTMTYREYVSMCADTTYGVISGGSPASTSLEYITIATAGNATSFGSLSTARSLSSSCAAGSRGVIGGSDGNVTLEYITIGTPSNSSTFGNLSSAGYTRVGAFANETRGVFHTGSTNFQYVTIATLGNATTFSTGNPNYYEAGSCSGT